MHVVAPFGQYSRAIAGLGMDTQLECVCLSQRLCGHNGTAGRYSSESHSGYCSSNIAVAQREATATGVDFI